MGKNGWKWIDVYEAAREKHGVKESEKMANKAMKKRKKVVEKEKKPTGFGLLNTSVPGAGLGSGFGFSGESKIARLKKKEKELKQQAATWKAEEKIKKLREKYGKPTLIDIAKNALLKRKEKKSIYN